MIFSGPTEVAFFVTDLSLLTPLRRQQGNTLIGVAIQNWRIFLGPKYLELDAGEMSPSLGYLGGGTRQRRSKIGGDQAISAKL